MLKLTVHVDAVETDNLETKNKGFLFFGYVDQTHSLGLARQELVPLS